RPKNEIKRNNAPNLEWCVIRKGSPASPRGPFSFAKRPLHEPAYPALGSRSATRARCGLVRRRIAHPDKRLSYLGAVVLAKRCLIRSKLVDRGRFVSKDSDQTEAAPRKFKLGPLGSLNQVTKGLAKTIRAMADGTLDSQVGARICNGLGIMRTCLETQKLEQLEAHTFTQRYVVAAPAQLSRDEGEKKYSLPAPAETKYDRTPSDESLVWSNE